MTALITLIALTIAPPAPTPQQPLVALPWKGKEVKQQVVIAMPLPLFKPSPPPREDLQQLAIDRFLAAEADAWFVAEAAAAASPLPPEPQMAVRAAPPPSQSTSWLHAWITDEILEALIFCESGGHGRYTTNTGNGFKGAVQWLQSTWNAAAARADLHHLVGVPPNLVTAADQDYVTKVWWSVSDYRTQWPVCGPRAVRLAG